MSYYRIDVTMKNGFKYSYTCVARMMPGMKEASHGYWVENVESTQITKEEHETTWGVYKEPAKKPEKVIPMMDPPKKIPKGTKVVPKKETTKNPKEATKEKTKIPKMASLENFFDGVEEAPKNKILKKRV